MAVFGNDDPRLAPLLNVQAEARERGVQAARLTRALPHRLDARADGGQVVPLALGDLVLAPGKRGFRRLRRRGRAHGFRRIGMAIAL